MSIFTSFLSKAKIHSSILKNKVERMIIREKKESPVELWGRMYGCMDERNELEMMVLLCSVLS
jgi:hypothetical protein